MKAKEINCSFQPALGCKLPKMDSSNLPSKNEKSKIDISPPVTNTSTDKREHSRESSRNVTPEKEGAGIKDKPPSASTPSVTFSNRAGNFLDNCNPVGFGTGFKEVFYFDWKLS